MLFNLVHNIAGKCKHIFVIHAQTNLESYKLLKNSLGLIP